MQVRCPRTTTPLMAAPRKPGKESMRVCEYMGMRVCKISEYASEVSEDYNSVDCSTSEAKTSNLQSAKILIL